MQAAQAVTAFSLLLMQVNGYRRSQKRRKKKDFKILPEQLSSFQAAF